jgi:hypothetical protein
MALKDIFRKKYNANVWCNNCSTHSEVSVPKGVTLTQFVENGACPNCGCATLVADYKQIDEFREQQPKPSVKLLRVGKQRSQPQPVVDYPRSRPIEPPKRAPLPPQRPSNRPENSLPPRRPTPVEPNFIPRGIFRDEIDFWKGDKDKRNNRRGEEEHENY